MTKSVRLSLLLIVGCSIPGLASADLCTLDDAPAATLLYPYFEVDLNQPVGEGQTTQIWFRNEQTSNRLVQVNVWSDFNIPVFGFQVYMPAFSTTRIDLADVLINGQLPSTGAAVSPISDFAASSSPTLFPACNNTADPQLGPPVTSQLSPSFLADLQARLTGNISFTTGSCFGSDYGDGVARGFVTIDVVQQCSLALPTSPGYWPTIADDENALTGGYRYVEPANNFARGGRAVGLEAAQAGEFIPGDVTFAGRFVSGTAVDAREPLPGRWHVEFDNDALGAQSELIVWRGAPQSGSGFFCGSGPSNWFPLADTQRVPFDRSGDTPPPPVVFPGQPIPQPELIALATQRFDSLLIDDTLQNAVDSGSAILALHTSSFAYPTTFEGQAYVAVDRTIEGRFAELSPATALDSFCTASTAIAADVSGPLAVNPNTPNFIFIDGFE